MKKLKNKKVIAIVLGLIIVSATAVFLTRKSVPSSVVDISPTPTEYPVDKENDGVYTNYKYGYKFEYPVDKFEQTHSSDITAVWDLNTDADSVQKSEMPIQLDVGRENNFREIYEQLYTQENKTLETRKFILTKLGTEDNNGLRMMRVFWETPPELAVGPTTEYQVLWFRQDASVIKLRLIASPVDEQALRQYKDLLWEIADSFEFIN